MAPMLLLSVFLGTQGVPASFKNIEVAGGKANAGFMPEEPSIAINRKNSNNVIVGANIDFALSTFNGGATWAEQHLTSPFGVWGDPALISDPKGNLYFVHLSSGKPPSGGWIDRIVCQKSTDGGKTWSSGAGIGLNLPKNQDKAWPAVHPTKPTICVTWTQFDKYGSKAATDHSNILFSVSNDAGVNWSKPVQINELSGDCLDSDDTTEGAVPAIGRDGTIYVAWGFHDKIYFDKSSDNGKTWMDHDSGIADQVAGWDLTIPGLDRSNGMPVLMMDNSGGPNDGNLYVVWGDQLKGPSDSDIFFSRSTDHGKTWSGAKRVNQDPPGKQQFLPWMAVDQSTGNISIVYYDRRAYSGLETDVYLANSTDGGKTFSEHKISEKPFTPSSAAFMGDYNNISASNGLIAPVWARMDGGKTTVWTAFIKQKDLAAK